MATDARKARELRARKRSKNNRIVQRAAEQNGRTKKRSLSEPALRKDQHTIRRDSAIDFTSRTKKKGPLGSRLKSKRASTHTKQVKLVMNKKYIGKKTGGIRTISERERSRRTSIPKSDPSIPKFKEEQTKQPSNSTKVETPRQKITKQLLKSSRNLTRHFLQVFLARRKDFRPRHNFVSSLGQTWSKSIKKSLSVRRRPRIRCKASRSTPIAVEKIAEKPKKVVKVRRTGKSASRPKFDAIRLLQPRLSLMNITEEPYPELPMTKQQRLKRLLEPGAGAALNLVESDIEHYRKPIRRPANLTRSEVMAEYLTKQLKDMTREQESRPKSRHSRDKKAKVVNKVANLQQPSRSLASQGVKESKMIPQAPPLSGADTRRLKESFKQYMRQMRGEEPYVFSNLGAVQIMTDTEQVAPKRVEIKKETSSRMLTEELDKPTTRLKTSKTQVRQKGSAQVVSENESKRKPVDKNGLKASTSLWIIKPMGNQAKRTKVTAKLVNIEPKKPVGLKEDFKTTLMNLTSWEDNIQALDRTTRLGPKASRGDRSMSSRVQRGTVKVRVQPPEVRIPHKPGVLKKLAASKPVSKPSRVIPQSKEPKSPVKVARESASPKPDRNYSVQRSQSRGLEALKESMSKRIFEEDFEEEHRKQHRFALKSQLKEVGSTLNTAKKPVSVATLGKRQPVEKANKGMEPSEVVSSDHKPKVPHKAADTNQKPLLKSSLKPGSWMPQTQPKVHPVTDHDSEEDAQASFEKIARLLKQSENKASIPKMTPVRFILQTEQRSEARKQSANKPLSRVRTNQLVDGSSYKLRETDLSSALAKGRVGPNMSLSKEFDKLQLAEQKLPFENPMQDNKRSLFKKSAKKLLHLDQMQEEPVTLGDLEHTVELGKLPNKFKVQFKKFCHLDRALDYLIKLNQKTPLVSVLQSHFRSLFN